MLLISGIVNIIGDKKMQDKTKKPDKWAFYIQNILEQNKVSQAGFARMCGVSRACVNLWVSNNRWDSKCGLVTFFVQLICHL